MTRPNDAKDWERIRRGVSSLPGVKPDSDEWWAYALFYASMAVGPFRKEVLRFTGADPNRVGWIIDNIEREGIWKDGEIRANWDSDNEDEAGTIVEDVECALGRMHRILKSEAH